jgi:hypothetical protein
MKPDTRRRQLSLLVALSLGLFALVCAFIKSQAQLGVRAQDPTGFSQRVPRVQVIHADKEEVPGTSMYLQRRDPWLAYQMGRAYFEREWNKSDGVLSFPINRPLAGAVNSCAMCHNLPFHTAGSGGNVSDPPGFGQNTPHLFGIGLVETIALQIRQQILKTFDLNHNGFLDVPAETKGQRAMVEATPGVKLDFGSLEDLNADGWPGLNDVMKVTFVDAQGRPVPVGRDGRPPRLGDAGVAGYDLAVGFLSSTRSDHQFASLRHFSIGVMQTVFGLPVADTTVTNDRGEGRDERVNDGWVEPSNAGARQLLFPLVTKDCGNRCLPVSAGELDLLEWFLLNLPAPALRRQTEETLRGRHFMEAIGCTNCHVADWRIQPADEKTGLTGDRRFFDLEVSTDAGSGKFTGKLRSLTRSETQADGATQYLPAQEGYTVKNIFTDLRHHDVGTRFYQYSSVGGQMYMNCMFRTPPLWGVASTAPYGHDGRSQTLDEVIRRHGGEAKQSAIAYAAAPARDRDALLAFLDTLTLYLPEELPTDINADGVIENSFRREGIELGPERFWPELLFFVVPRYRGWITQPDGPRYFSYELLNAQEVYGRNLRALADKDGNGVPDEQEFPFPKLFNSKSSATAQ